MRCSNAQKIQPNGRCTNRKILTWARILSMLAFPLSGLACIAHRLLVDPKALQCFQDIWPPKPHSLAQLDERQPPLIRASNPAVRGIASREFCYKIPESRRRARASK